MKILSARTPRHWVRVIAARPKHLLLDICGNINMRWWKPMDEFGVGTIQPDAIPRVLECYSGVFKRSPWDLKYYSRLFPRTFYIAEEGSSVIGFCVCNVHPALSQAGVIWKARILALGVRPTHQGQGVARRLIDRCMAEMARNGIASIDLYVDTENLHAILVYSHFGLQVVGEVRDVCGQGKTCHRMERTFSQIRGDTGQIEQARPRSLLEKRF